MNKNRVAVIGGGASGLVAGITLARGGAVVTIYERLDRVGKKLLATGNGRCNLSNLGASENDYHGSGASIISNAINTFWVEDTLSFFSSIGLVTKCEADGKLYPYSDRASSVLDVLRIEANRVGVKTVTGCEVTKVKYKNEVFKLSSACGEFDADYVVLACGGCASSSLGSNGSGYTLAKAFGHSVTDLRPAIVQLKTTPELVRSLKGIKVNATLSYNGQDSIGELLFTDYGISGPPAFFLSSYYKTGLSASVDFMSEYAFNDVVELLQINKNRTMDDNGLFEDVFVGILNKRVGMQLIKYINHKPSEPISSIKDGDIRVLAKAIKNYTLPITGLMSWNNAQVSAGGVSCYEVDDKTLESKKQHGLYITGELLDVDGNCGGYNLQFAWSSGAIAANNILKDIEN